MFAEWVLMHSPAHFEPAYMDFASPIISRYKPKDGNSVLTVSGMQRTSNSSYRLCLCYYQAGVLKWGYIRNFPNWGKPSFVEGGGV